jgi:hypothetical protein
MIKFRVFVTFLILFYIPGSGAGAGPKTLLLRLQQKAAASPAPAPAPAPQHWYLSMHSTLMAVYSKILQIRKSGFTLFAIS